MSKIRFTEDSEPSTPASGKVVVYADSSDGHLKQKDDTGTVRDLAASAASGDVVGPSSAVDDNIPSYDGTTGKLIQDSGLTTAEITSNTSHRSLTNNPHSVTASQLNITDTHSSYNATNVDGAIDEIAETRWWNGYDRQTAASMPDLAFDNSTRTLTVSVKSGSSDFYFWAGGYKHTKTTSQTVVLPDTTDSYFCYFDVSGVLQYVSHSAIPEAAFYDYALTALVRWNSTQATSGLGDERHGVRMSGATHEQHHRTVGATYESGFNIEGLVSGSTTFTQLTSGYMFDEDIRHSLNACSTVPTLYMYGAAGAWTAASATNEVGLKESGDTYYSYNYWDGSTWTLREGTSSTDYYIIFFAQTPQYEGSGAVRFLGQNAYSSRSKARDAIDSEINKLKLDGLPSPEILFTHAIIIKRDGKVQTLADGSLYVDLRALKGGTTGTSASSNYADDIITEVTDFNTHLSSTDTSVQKALDTLDDHTHTASQVSDFDTEVSNNTSVTANTAKVTYPGSADATELNILDGATLSTTELNYVKNVTSAIQTQLDDKNEKDLTIDAKTANYTVVAGDNNKILHCSNSITITFPDSLDTGVNVTIVNIGTGTITLSAATTLNTKDSKVTITSQYGAVSAYHAGSNVWYAYGDLA